MAQTVVGLLDNAHEAHAALQDLLGMGVARASINIMVPRSDDTLLLNFSDDLAEEPTSEDVGVALSGIGGLLFGLSELPLPGVGRMSAAGPVAATLAGLGLGAAAWSALGAICALGVPSERVSHYAEAMARGSTLLSAEIPDDMLERVTEVMHRHEVLDLHTREGLSLRGAWCNEISDFRGRASSRFTVPDGTRGRLGRGALTFTRQNTQPMAV